MNFIVILYKYPRKEDILMKKHLSVLLVLILLFSLAVPVSARSFNMEKGLAPVSIEKPDGIISLPEDFLIIPNYTLPTDPTFKELKQNGRTFMKDMKDLDMVIYASSKDLNEDAYLTVSDSEGTNYNDYDADELLELADQIVETMDESGVKVSDYGLSVGAVLDYIYVIYKNSDTDVYVIEYISQYEGKMYGFCYRQQGKPLSDEQLDTAKAITTSLTFKDEPFLLWDEEMTFFIDCPPGAYSDPGFAAANEAEVAVKLPKGTGSYLIFDTHTGSDVPKGNVTKEMAAKFLEVPSKYLSSETYGSNQYFNFTLPDQTIIGGNPQKYIFDSYLAFHDGTVYLLTFAIDETEKGKNNDFIEKMLEYAAFVES